MDPLHVLALVLLVVFVVSAAAAGFIVTPALGFAALSAASLVAALILGRE